MPSPNSPPGPSSSCPRAAGAVRSSATAPGASVPAESFILRLPAPTARRASPGARDPRSSPGPVQDALDADDLVARVVHDGLPGRHVAAQELGDPPALAGDVFDLAEVLGGAG